MSGDKKSKVTFTPTDAARDIVLVLLCGEVFGWGRTLLCLAGFVAGLVILAILAVAFLRKGA